jgi:hypothetical protein
VSPPLHLHIEAKARQTCVNAVALSALPFTESASW